jgi:hypothetical protein
VDAFVIDLGQPIDKERGRRIRHAVEAIPPILLDDEPFMGAREGE